MALTKKTVVDKVEVVGEHKMVQCREATTSTLSTTVFFTKAILTLLCCYKCLT